jgi:hypothetical protein
MPTKLKGFSDFDDRDPTNNKVMVYNSETDSFILQSLDLLLSDSTKEDAEFVPEDFIRQLETKLDPNNIEFKGVDAGTF